MQTFKHILAPFSGFITERSIDQGSLISAGSNNSPQQLFELAQIDVLRAFVDVPQHNFRSIQIGLPVDIRVAEFPGRVFQGKVTRTASALDPIARTLRTQIDIENPKEELLPGVYAEVTFSLSSPSPRFTIPAEALLIRTGPPQVALVNSQNTIVIRDVTIGLDNGSTLEITEGLQEGDLLVLNPTFHLENGISVSIHSDSSSK